MPASSDRFVAVIPLATLLPLFAETVDAAEEGRKIITAMLIVGLVFISVIVIGELAKYVLHKRREY
jgi:K+-transporting ATPase A subunit